MTLDAFDLDAAGYPAWSEEFQPSVDAIRDELIRLRCLLLPHATEPKAWTAWRSYYEDSLSATFVSSVYPVETRALITKAFRDPNWEHARGISTLQRVPFTIDPVILDLVDRFAVKIMGRSEKQRFNDHRTVNTDIDTANYLLGEPLLAFISLRLARSVDSQSAFQLRQRRPRQVYVQVCQRRSD